MRENQGRYRKVFKVLTDILYYQMTDNKHLINKSLYNTFMELGGVYIKFLQHLSLNNKFFIGWGEHLPRVAFEQVKATPVDINKFMLTELNDNFRENFLSVEEKPFAAGSFAQVYKAKLKNGDVVVIKVLRPGLMQNLKADLTLIKTFSKIIKLFASDMMLDIDSVFEQFEKTTLEETNYKKELKNALWFYNYYKDNNNVVIPRVYPELSTQNIITQEFIDGVSLAHILNMHIENKHDIYSFVSNTLNSDLNKQLKIIGVELMHGSLFADVVQGDPHPGNLRLLSDNRVAFLDFGIVAKTPKDGQAFYDLVDAYRGYYNGKFDIQNYTKCILRFVAEDLYFAIQQINTELNGDDLIEKVGLAAAKFLNIDLHDTESLNYNNQKQTISKLFSTVINEGNRFGIHMKPESLNLMKSAQIYMNVLNTIDPGANLMSDVLNITMHKAEQQKHYLKLSKRKDFTTAEALTVVSAWLAEIAQKDPKLFKLLNSKI